MSDTTRNDGTVDGQHVAPSAPAYRDPEPLDHDARADTGAHAATERIEASSDTASPAHAADRDATARHTTATQDTVAHETVAHDTVVHDTAASDTATQTDYVPTPAEHSTVQQSQPTPIYVQAPVPPRNKGNRGPGILIALIATVAYAALFAILVSIISGLASSSVAEATRTFSEFIIRPVFYIPVIFFFLALAALIAIVNRAGWWAYVLGGFLVAVVVYFSYIGGALLTVRAWEFTPSEAGRFIGTQWLTPFAVGAAVLAREVPIWFGAWIARNGRKVTARNQEARKEYDRQIAEGPQLVRP